MIKSKCVIMKNGDKTKLYPLPVELIPKGGCLKFSLNSAEADLTWWKEAVIIAELDDVPLYVRNIKSGQLIPFTYIDGELSFEIKESELSCYEVGMSADGFITDIATEILNEYQEAFLELAK